METHLIWLALVLFAGAGLSNSVNTEHSGNLVPSVVPEPRQLPEIVPEPRQPDTVVPEPRQPDTVVPEPRQLENIIPEPRPLWQTTSSGLIEAHKAVPRAKCNCGLKQEAVRIVGGSHAAVSEFPWRVALYSPSMGAFCAGTIISPNWVMTASHCTAAVSSTTELFIDAADHDLSTTKETTNKLVKIDRMIQHESYDSKTQNNDISLLHLSTPLTYGKSIQPICLPWSLKGQTFANKTVTGSGWGTTSSGGKASYTLLKVDLPVLSSQQCQKYYGKSVNENNICTYQVGKDTCQGDSGGSIDFKNPVNAQFYGIGVVSWGVGCAKDQYPGVYTKVDNYLSWISSKTGESFCQS